MTYLALMLLCSGGGPAHSFYKARDALQQQARNQDTQSHDTLLAETHKSTRDLLEAVYEDSGPQRG